jgi:two-component system, LytTR family, sensor kinase
MYAFIIRYKVHHLLFWATYILLQSFIYQRFDGGDKALMNALIVNAFHAAAVYFNFYFLIPRLLLLKRYLLYFFMLGCAVFLCSYALMQLMMFIEPDSRNILLETFSGLFTGVFFTVTITMVVKIMINWYQQQQLNIQLEKQQAETELKFLKSQIQPHFLFNVLNNIYSLALQKSDQTPDVVLRLSEFLRYILYEAGDKKIELQKEISYLENYIELQKLRFGNRADIDFKVEGELLQQQIEPMLLITFVENSFKHGVSSMKERVWVKIHIALEEGRLIFEVSNSKTEGSRAEQAAGGIGLENLKRRLQLLYPGQHQLSIEDGKNEYRVQLIIHT